MIIKFPNQKRAGTKNKDLISFIDYSPTVLSLAGIKPPDVMQGKAQFGPHEALEKASFIFASSDRFD